jgi:uncharacterized repeat protein (TIGR03843 family)
MSVPPDARSDQPTDETDADLNRPTIGLTLSRVLDVLERGTVLDKYGRMPWSTNYTFLIGVRNGDIEVPAVYKPVAGERPLWDFPDGTLAQRERAAFLTSDVLGWMIVPPTVLREGPHGLGSIQFYIDHDPERHYFTFDDSLRPQVLRLALFDVIINNADRKGGHCLLDSQGHVWGIDHGISFHAQNKLRTVIWDYAGEPIAEELLADCERLLCTLEDASSAYKQALCQLLTSAEIMALGARIRRLLRARTYPAPGPGPNYPWPPV